MDLRPPEAVSEAPSFKNFLGEDAPTPPTLCGVLLFGLPTICVLVTPLPPVYIGGVDFSASKVAGHFEAMSNDLVSILVYDLFVI